MVDDPAGNVENVLAGVPGEFLLSEAFYWAGASYGLCRTFRSGRREDFADRLFVESPSRFLGVPDVRFAGMNRGQCGKFAMTAALSAGLLTLTGCGYINDQQTTEQYVASDGTHAKVGPVQLRNMLIVASDEDQPGRVLGAIYNSSSRDVTVTLRGAEGAKAEIPVERNSYTLLNDSTSPVVLSAAGAKPGSLVDIKVTEGSTNLSQTVKVPVVDATLAEYAPYLPGGSPTPTPSVTSTSTESPAPSEGH